MRMSVSISDGRNVVQGAFEVPQNIGLMEPDKVAQCVVPNICKVLQGSLKWGKEENPNKPFQPGVTR